MESSKPNNYPFLKEDKLPSFDQFIDQLHTWKKLLIGHLKSKSFMTLYKFIKKEYQ